MNQFLAAEHPITLTGQEDGEAFYRYYKDERGFDAAIKGEWQENYAAMIDAVFGLRGKRLLDLGAAMGALTVSMQELGADVWGIEINRYFVEHSPFGSLHGRLLLGDVLDTLLVLRDGVFDLIHASQILEHIAPERQGSIILELGRVLKVGGLLFASMPMEGGADHGITDRDDSTHVCIRSHVWWNALRHGLFRDANPVYEERLRSQPMYQEYRWDHFIWERR